MGAAPTSKVESYYRHAVVSPRVEQASRGHPFPRPARVAARVDEAGRRVDAAERQNYAVVVRRSSCRFSRRQAAPADSDKPPGGGLAGDARRRSDAETAFTEAGLLQLAQQCRDRQFTVLGVEAPRDEAWPWHEDWRYGYRWPPRYFRNYDFYRKDRPAPADVKLPWELSRLGFLIAVVQAEAISPQGRWMDAALAVVLDWERQNPLAFSVAWHPMEAAMRGLNLAMLLDMSISLDAAPVPLVRCCGC